MNKKWASYPYLIWMIIFIVIPSFLILFYAFTIRDENGIRFTLENFYKFCEPVYITVLLKSLGLALFSTLVCLVLGYPVAMILASKQFSKRTTLSMLFIIPMWMNFLLRTYAWLTLLEKNGIINSILSFLNLPKFDILYTNAAVVLGMVYNFLPFMILPIYTVLMKIDGKLVEAAQDLGGNTFTVFRRITLPLSIPGVMSGITMVFMPAVTTFVISKLLGGGQYTLIGNFIERQFIQLSDWNFGSAISMIMMIFILISIAIMSKFDEDKGGGAALW
ncbi:MAG: binding-protein-dependent transport system inner rane component [Eubacterium sp.]|jgi:spermidine/putrescine transport system permease protein|nr:binding-protein-dependent transport system inner rane component [Eubacterium sp.]